MERAIEPCLADDVIAALGNPTKDLVQFVNSRGAREAADLTRAEIRQAIRFEVTPELLETAYQLSLDDFHTLNDRAKSARPCYDLMWIEWDENVRQEIIGGSYTTFSRVGYLVTPTNPRVTKGSLLDIDDGHYFTGFYTEGELLQKGVPLLLESRKSDSKREQIWTTLNCFVLKTPGFLPSEMFKITGIPGYDKYLEYPQSNKSREKLKNNQDVANSVSSHLHQLNYWLGREWVAKHCGEAPVKGEAYPDAALDGPIEAAAKEMMRRALSVQTRSMKWVVSEEKWRAGWAYDDKFMAEANRVSAECVDGDLRWLLTIMWMINHDWIVVSEPRKATKGKIRHGKVRPLNTFHRLKLALPKEHIIIKANEIGYGTPKRQHDVRGHFRVLKNPHRRIWIRSHKRGDPSLGVIMKDYVLDKTKDNYKPDPYQTYDSVW